MKIKRLFNYDYPKLTGLIIAIALAYYLFNIPAVSNFVSGLNSLSYLGVFIAGMMFTFGFTSPFSAGFFIVLNPSTLSSTIMLGLLGGFGAMIADLLIFKFIRFSFMGEFRKLEKTKILRAASNLIDRAFGQRIKTYLLYAFAGILIASPMPDEAGVIMLAGLTKIKPKTLALLSFTLNTAGIIVLMLI